jgi:hypothetical protein
MPHYPKPFFKKSHQSWFVQLSGKQIPLGKDESKALVLNHGLMKDRAAGLPLPVNSDKSDNLLVLSERAPLMD